MKQRWYGLFPPLLAVLIYAVSLRNGFVFDDRIVLVTDERMGDLGAFFRVSWGELVVRYWSLLIDSVIWGMNPMGYHLTNLLLHAAVGLLLFLYLRRLLHVFKGKKPALGALVGALLLVAHPMNTEAVAAISHRKEMLAGFFLLLALYRSEVPRRTFIRSLEVSVYLALALLSKAPAVVFFPLLITTDFLQGRKQVKFFVAPVAVAVAYVASRLAGISTAVVTSSHYEAFNPQMVDAPLLNRVFTSMKTLGMYWWLGVWPWRPTMERFVPQVSLGEWAPWLVLVLWVLGGIFAWKWRRKHPLVSLGLVWLMVTPLPTINLIPLNFLFSERYMYVPLLGFGLIAAWVVAQETRLWMSGLLLFLTLGVFSPLVVLRNLDWKDSSRLLAVTVRDNPNSPRLNRFYAMDLNRQGRHTEALAAAKISVQGMPRSPTNWYVYAQTLSVNGKLEEAAQAYKHAIDVSRNPPGMWISNYGVALAMSGNLEKAQEVFSKALAKTPGDPRVRLHYAQGLLMSPQTQLRAVDFMVETLRADSKDQSLWALLAETRLAQGNLRASYEAARKGLQNGSEPMLTAYLQGLELEAQRRPGEAKVKYESMMQSMAEDPQLISRVQRALRRVSKK